MTKSNLAVDGVHIISNSPNFIWKGKNEQTFVVLHMQAVRLRAAVGLVLQSARVIPRVGGGQIAEPEGGAFLQEAVLISVPGDAQVVERTDGGAGECDFTSTLHHLLTTGAWDPHFTAVWNFSVWFLLVFTAPCTESDPWRGNPCLCQLAFPFKMGFVLLVLKPFVFSLQKNETNVTITVNAGSNSGWN